MDRITTIETEITKTLNLIDKSLQPSGYQYYTNTGTVMVYDEVLSLAKNRTIAGEDITCVNYTYDVLDNIEVTDYSIGQLAMTSVMYVVITATLHNVVTTSPKNEIKVKMNECYSDLLYAFNTNYTLNGTINYLKCINYKREYDTTNNRITSGKIITTWYVEFNQDFNNPDIPNCW